MGKDVKKSSKRSPISTTKTVEGIKSDKMKYFLVPAAIYDQNSKPIPERSNIEHMLPKRLQSKTKLINTQLHSIGVDHDKNDRILLDEIPLEGSNYIDFIRYLVYKRNLPQNWDTIKDYLNKKNFPKSLIPTSESNKMDKPSKKPNFVWL